MIVEDWMIELSAQKYWKRMNYYDGLLYCSLLDIDEKDNWRMMDNYHEYLSYRGLFPIFPMIPEKGKWYMGDVRKSSEENLKGMDYWVIPVRDV